MGSSRCPRHWNKKVAISKGRRCWLDIYNEYPVLMSSNIVEIFSNTVTSQATPVYEIQVAITQQ